jgi:hypothetical protein
MPSQSTALGRALSLIYLQARKPSVVKLVGSPRPIVCRALAFCYDPLVFALVVIGFAGFGSAVIYEQAQHCKTGGAAFEGRKAIVFPWIVISWLIFGVGFVILVVNENQRPAREALMDRLSGTQSSAKRRSAIPVIRVHWAA